MTQFFNTTHLTGQDLGPALASAQTQDDAILSIYRKAGGPLSPTQAWELYQRQGRECPPTSVRRSVTCLTKQGKLVRLDRKRIGNWGRWEYLWALAGCDA